MEMTRIQMACQFPTVLKNVRQVTHRVCASNTVVALSGVSAPKKQDSEGVMNHPTAEGVFKAYTSGKLD